MPTFSETVQTYRQLNNHLGSLPIGDPRIEPGLETLAALSQAWPEDMKAAVVAEDMHRFLWFAHVAEAPNRAAIEEDLRRYEALLDELASQHDATVTRVTAQVKQLPA